MPTLANIQGGSLVADPTAVSRGLATGFGLGNAYRQRGIEEEQRQAQAQRQAQISRLTPEALRGGQEARVRLYQLDPQLAKTIDQTVVDRDEATQKKLIQFNNDTGAFAGSIINESPEIQRQRLMMKAQEYKDQGNNAASQEALRFASMASQDPDGLNSELMNDIAISENAKTYMDLFGLEQKEGQSLKQATGKGLEGYIFDPNTGSLTINPALQRQLSADASRLSEKEQLGAKDISGINDKVTALTKDVSGIADAASSLDALKTSSSPASQIAAVFKFMKALDPTSTVRESELGLVYGAQGAAQGIANKINSLMGAGGLSEQGFQDIVTTSKELANSAITSSNTAVTDYLNVIQDNMTPKQYQRMIGRVPSSFDIADKPKSVTVDY